MATKTLAHRIQYVEWNPFAISSIALSPDNKYLACGRNNGKVEIWNVDNDFHMESLIPGREGTMISCLGWHQPPPPPQAKVDTSIITTTNNNNNNNNNSMIHPSPPPQLFAAGLHGEIYEIDLNRLRSTNVTDSYGGAVWEFVIDSEDSKLYAACDDGSIRKFNISHNVLEYEQSYPRTNKRLLTICMQNDIIYAAGEEGVIRSWNKSTGESLPNYIELEKVRNSNTNEIHDTIVWSLKVLSDHTLISGDSLGHVQIWDGYSGSLISSFSQHTADVVALAVNEKENIVFASGVDHKVVMLRLIESGRSGKKTWKYTYAHRAHTHDVKCLAIGTCNVYHTSQNQNHHHHNAQQQDNKKKRKRKVENGNDNNNNANTDIKYIAKEIVFSGGIDTQICYYDVNKFEITRPRKIMPYPQQNNIFDVCKAKRLLLSRFDTSIKIWKLKDTGKRDNSNNKIANKSIEKNYNNNNPAEEEILLYDIDLSETCRGMHTTCSSISSNGEYLAVGFQKGLRIYKLGIASNSIRAIKMPQSIIGKGGILCVKFSPCNKRFVFSTDLGAIYIGHIGEHDTITFTTMQTPPHKLYNVSENNDIIANGHTTVSKNNYNYLSPITMLSISVDSQWVAVGVLNTNSIYIYSLDSFRYHSTVPITKYQFTSFEFIGNTASANGRASNGTGSPTSSSSGTIHLIVTCLHNLFYLYDIDEAKLSWWHNANPVQTLPKQFINRREKIIGVINTPEEPDVVIMYTMNYFIKIDFTQAVPSNKQDIIIYENRMNQRYNRNGKSGYKSSSSSTVIKNFRLTDRYRPILYVNYLNSPNELVIIERPWVKILQEFTNPVKLKRYGAE